MYTPLLTWCSLILCWKGKAGMFKEEIIEGPWSGKIIETAIRRHSARKHHSLQIISSVYPNMSEKYFVGYEKAHEIDFCRIRTSYEVFLPKMIIRFNKADFTRYTLHPTIAYVIGYPLVCVIMIAGFFTNLFGGMLFDAFFVCLWCWVCMV